MASKTERSNVTVVNARDEGGCNFCTRWARSDGLAPNLRVLLIEARSISMRACGPCATGLLANLRSALNVLAPEPAPRETGQEEKSK